jgi:hypothetical protein
MLLDLFELGWHRLFRGGAKELVLKLADWFTVNGKPGKQCPG